MVQAVQKQLSLYKNENLFSRHYLKKVIQRTNIWDVDEDEIEEAFEELEEIYEEQKELLPHRTDDEEEVRNEFITPILRRVLDFKKEQEKKSGNSQEIPDYALYDNKEKKNRAVKSKDYYKHAVGLVEAKAWKKDLEKKTSTGDPSKDDSNPTKQIVDYLIDNKPQWGVLTNGKKWRLVHREASNHLDTYYEVDIENLLTSDRPREERLEEFKYFYIFFRKQAFQGDEGDKVLDEILEESLQYAEEIGEDLEENIYQALEWLAKGYLENNSNEGIEDVPIGKIHDNSLIYLYRLLFALYADSRGILGDPGGKYEYYNFSELVDEVCEEIDEGDGYGKTGLISNRLNSIFRMIDEGSQSQDIPEEELHIPAYNGGLFNQEKHEFLKKYNLHDKYLAKVIDLLARTERQEGGKAQVDYYDLSVRHLGGIYEGLLEYKLKRAEEDLVEVRKSGSTVMMSLEEAEDKNKRYDENTLVKKGEPYLVTDQGDRKATGSYYTPDYVVKYIVKDTLEPLIERKLEGAESDSEKAEAIQNIKILDPAMGSAHFPVEVVDFLASKLVQYDEIDIDKAKRKIASKCIYAVDVNPLATELGKLSLWLNTIAEDKPLSFLDHHIKTGNSLIGADIHDINRHPEEDEDSERQVTIGEEFGEENAGVVRANVQEMLKKFKKIQEKQADSPQDIKEQEELYQEFLDFPFRKRFDVLADVYTSHYFDNDYKVDDYNKLLQAFKLQEQKEEDENEEWSEIVQEDWVREATDSLDKHYKEGNISEKKGFFHWKLEFPEVFFDIEEGKEKEDSGFDAVVGNPPWDVLEARKTHFNNEEDYKEFKEKVEEDKKYYRDSEKYPYSMGRKLNLFRLFIERSHQFLNEEARFGFIVPSSLLADDSVRKSRELLFDNTSVEQFFEVPKHVELFEGVTQAVTVFVTENSGSTEKFEFLSGIEDYKNTHEMDFIELEKSQIKHFSEDELSIPLIESKRELDVLEKIYRGEKLDEKINAFQGEVNISSDRDCIRSEPTDTLLVRGVHVGRFLTDLSDGDPDRRWLDKKKFLNKKSGQKTEHHKKKRIVQQGITGLSDQRRFHTSLLPEGNFSGHSINYYLAKDDEDELEYYVGLLNSLLMEWRFRLTSTNNNVNSYEVEKLPYIESENKDKISNKVKQILEINREITEEKSQFLGWLRDYWSVDINKLSLKKNLKNYEKHDWDELMRIAKRNSGKIDKDIESRDFRDRMKKEWDSTTTTITPLEKKAEKLENSIESLIFQDYNITKKEMKTILNKFDLTEEKKNSILN